LTLFQVRCNPYLAKGLKDRDGRSAKCPKILGLVVAKALGRENTRVEMLEFAGLDMGICSGTLVPNTAWAVEDTMPPEVEVDPVQSPAMDAVEDGHWALEVVELQFVAAENEAHRGRQRLL